ncbi:SufE family protein [Amnibacterium flavum]|uniref:Cysteine desulfuration protein SufE n=1 Tax=Amnibacterium flavum TaxID=2173173 RepID=A0A2V1HNU7_9MICO|nr:SufE family protein [Amnibacterium flavum]PVZ94313.1 cysteine desulfuration protein SufE [Amnibacterium flavum]
MTTTLPAQLAEIRDEFLELEGKDRLELLLEFANDLPALPERLRDDPALTERVEECQAPVYIALEVADGVVQMHATAPREAPTTRGFASILVQGLSGLSTDEVLAVPSDYPQMLGLNELVSPLRVRGMTGMLARAKRQVNAKLGA